MKTFFLTQVHTGAVLILIGLLTACSSNHLDVKPTPAQPASPIQVQNARLVFENVDHFLKTLSEIRQFPSSEQMSVWESKYAGYTSLRHYNVDHPLATRLDDMSLTLAYKTLLNANGEVVIGDNIVWFDGGYDFFIPKEDEPLLTRVKQNPASYSKKYQVVRTLISRSEGTPYHRTNGVVITDDGPDARYQHEWLMNNTSNDRRKTVYEIDAVRTFVGSTNNDGNIYDWSFNMNVKLEWWWRGWKPNASEPRDATVDVTGAIQPVGAVTVIPIIPAQWNLPTSPFHATTQYDLNFVLRSGQQLGNGTDVVNSFTYSLQGSISCFVKNGNGVIQTASPYSIGPGALWEN